MWVTQAALPFLQAQGSGHIIQVPSIGGIIALPLVGIYQASKRALEGFAQALAQEVAGFGIFVTLVEPGGFSTDWSGSSSKRSEPLAVYAELHETVDAARRQRSAAPGDSVATRSAILKVVDSDRPPLRIFFGDAPLGIATADYASRIALWKQWNDVSIEAQGPAN